MSTATETEPTVVLVADDNPASFSNMSTLEYRGPAHSNVQPSTEPIIEFVTDPEVQTPVEPPTPHEEIEMIVLPSQNSSSPILNVAPANAKAHRRIEIIQLAALYWCYFLEGWNDGSNGPLLPSMQKFYHVGFAIVSLIFVLNCLGFVSGAFLNITIGHRFGFGAMVISGAVLQAVAYVIQAISPPFPVFVATFLLSGAGISIQNAQGSAFVASLKSNSATKMGMLHATYGVGALVSPLSATHFASTPHWNFQYLVSLGIAISNIVVLSTVFRLQTIEAALARAGQAPREQNTSEDSMYKQILRMKIVHLLAFFIIAYVGVEVTIGGWIVTFVIDKRGGGASSGYLTSGFFAGITLGRIALLWLNQKVGERRVVLMYISLAIGLELTIWFVPSLVSNAIAVAFIGLVLGPIYPIVMNRTARLVPPWLLTGCVAWIAGFGQTGSALLPFATGALASKFGVGSLQPLLITIMGLMVGLWVIVPPEVKQD